MPDRIVGRVGVSRREALRVFGIGAGLVVSGFEGMDIDAAGRNAAGAQTVTFPRGAVIRTVLNDLSPGALTSGPTLFHEHMSISHKFFATLRATASPNPNQPPPPESWFTEDFDVMADEVRAAKEAGIVCIVDAGTAGHGRSIDFLKRLSIKTGMAIVASGGYYTEPAHPPDTATKSEDELADALFRDATTERWGAFKISSSKELTARERKAFRAVAKTHVRTHLPIITHTDNGSAALDQLDIFESLGVKPQSVAIGHLGGLMDPEVRVHSAVAKRGAFVAFDRVGNPKRPEVDEKQVPMIQALIAAGYAEHVLLSSDFGGDPTAIKRNGGPGYAKTITVFVPLLRKAGVTEEVVHRITVDNPRRFLAFVPKK